MSKPDTIIPCPPFLLLLPTLYTHLILPTILDLKIIFSRLPRRQIIAILRIALRISDLMPIFETDWRTISLSMIGSATSGGWDVEVLSVVVDEAIGGETIKGRGIEICARGTDGLQSW